MADIDEIEAGLIRDYRAAIQRLERQITTARRILADPERLRKMAEWRLQSSTNICGWEREADDPPDQPQQLWGGAVEDFATGEGRTLFYFVTWARGEADFRRAFAARVGRELANRAWVGEPLQVHPLYRNSFLSPETVDLIGCVADRREASPGFAFFAQLHRNMS